MFRKWVLFPSSGVESMKRIGLCCVPRCTVLCQRCCSPIYICSQTHSFAPWHISTETPICATKYFFFFFLDGTAVYSVERTVSSLKGFFQSALFFGLSFQILILQSHDTPTLKRSFLAQDTPILKHTIMPENTPILKHTLVSQDTPILNHTLMPENTPILKHTLMPENTPILKHTLMPENTPILKHTLVP